MPALEVVKENLNRSSLELDALNQLLENASEDAKSGYNTLIRESEAQASAAPQFARCSLLQRSLFLSPKPVGTRLLSSKPMKPFPSMDKLLLALLFKARRGGSGSKSKQAQLFGRDDSELRSELENSKSMQKSELSTDTANLQSDLRKAYREIVSLQSNLRESEMMVSELQNAKIPFGKLVMDNSLMRIR